MSASGRRSAAAAWVAGATLVLAGCGGPAGGYVIEVRKQHNVLFALADAPRASADALLEGTLVVNADGCLGVGDRPTVVVFPYRTAWVSPTAVRIEGRTVTVGDQVQLGGGVTAPGDPGSSVLSAMVERDCPHASGEVFVS